MAIYIETNIGIIGPVLSDEAQEFLPEGAQVLSITKTDSYFGTVEAVKASLRGSAPIFQANFS